MQIFQQETRPCTSTKNKGQAMDEDRNYHQHREANENESCMPIKVVINQS